MNGIENTYTILLSETKSLVSWKKPLRVSDESKSFLLKLISKHNKYYCHPQKGLPYNERRSLRKNNK